MPNKDPIPGRTFVANLGCVMIYGGDILMMPNTQLPQAKQQRIAKRLALALSFLQGISDEDLESGKLKIVRDGDQQSML